MTQAFIHGFFDELTKQASHPLFQTVARGNTMLGQKVRGAMTRTAKKSEKAGNRAARGAGLKGVVEKTSAAKLAFFENEDEEGSDEGEGSEADDAGEMLRRMMQQYQQDAGYSEEPDAAADQPLYGGGKGLSAQRAPRRPAAPKPPSRKPPTNTK